MTMLHLSTYPKLVLEYGNIIWGPTFVLDQQHVEKVQKRARYVIFATVLIYNSRNLPSLKYRRHQGDMTMIYHLLHLNLNVDPSDLLTINTYILYN